MRIENATAAGILNALDTPCSAHNAVACAIYNVLQAVACLTNSRPVKCTAVVRRSILCNEGKVVRRDEVQSSVKRYSLQPRSVTPQVILFEITPVIEEKNSSHTSDEIIFECIL